MRIHNNTTFNLDYVLADQLPLLKTRVDLDLVESITFDKDKTTVFGIDCILAEYSLTNRWPYDTMSQDTKETK